MSAHDTVRQECAAWCERHAVTDTATVQEVLVGLLDVMEEDENLDNLAMVDACLRVVGADDSVSKTEEYVDAILDNYVSDHIGRDPFTTVWSLDTIAEAREFARFEANKQVALAREAEEKACGRGRFVTVDKRMAVTDDLDLFLASDMAGYGRCVPGFDHLLVDVGSRDTQVISAGELAFELLAGTYRDKTPREIAYETLSIGASDLERDRIDETLARLEEQTRMIERIVSSANAQLDKLIAEGTLPEHARPVLCKSDKVPSPAEVRKAASRALESNRGDETAHMGGRHVR